MQAEPRILITLFDVDVEQGVSRNSVFSIFSCIFFFFELLSPKIRLSQTKVIPMPIKVRRYSISPK